MDDRTRLRKLVGEMADAFPRSGTTAETWLVYARELSDLPIDALERAGRALIRTSEFFPTIRALREAVAEATLGLPSEADALTQIEQRMAWTRTTRTEEPPALHPLVREALTHVGGWHALRSAEKPEVVRGQFLRLYREIRGHAIRDVQVGHELQAGPQRPELTA